jgi:hypothetical protein
MIVATMKAEEIHKEIMKDYKSLVNRAHTAGLLFQQEMKRKGLENETRTLTYKTAHRNEWTILFRMTDDWIEKSFYAKTYDEVGAVAYTIQFIHWGTEAEDYQITKYNSHFFKEYNERMVLGITNPAKIVQHFFKNNFDKDIEETPLWPDEKQCIHLLFNEGIGIGWQEDAKKTIHIKTFIDNYTILKNKRESAEHNKNGIDVDDFQITIPAQNMINKAS